MTFFMFSALIYMGCDYFLNTQQGRENPLDPENPVQPVENFHAVAQNSTSILLTLSPPSDPESQTTGYIIVRKENDWPASISDGITVVNSDMTNFSHVDEDVIPDTEYWYAVWSYGSDSLSEHYTLSGQNRAWTVDLATFTDFFAAGTSTGQVHLWWDILPIGETPAKIRINRFDDQIVAPSSPDEGVFVVDLTTIEDGEYYDTGTLPDTRYGYAVWAYDQDDSLFPLFPYQTDIADTTMQTLVGYAIEDGWVDDMGGNDGGGLDLFVMEDAAPPPEPTLSLIRFDLPGFNSIEDMYSAQLTLYCRMMMMPGEVAVAPITGLWSEGTLPSWATVNSGSFVNTDPGYVDARLVTAVSTYYSWDIYPIAYDWRWKGLINNGLLLAFTATMIELSFSSREDGGNQPVLLIEYFN